VAVLLVWMTAVVVASEANEVLMLLVLHWQWGSQVAALGTVECGDQGDKVDAAVVTKAERLKGGANEGGLGSGERCSFRSNAPSLSLNSSTS
jgi:hypothetical protein